VLHSDLDAHGAHGLRRSGVSVERRHSPQEQSAAFNVTFCAIGLTASHVRDIKS
jgi:hypothetical protein